MLIQTVIGNENWSSGTTKFHMFVCPTTQFPLNGKEEHLWMVAQGARRGMGNGPAVQVVGAPRVVPAGEGLKPEICGKWTEQVYDVPENVLLKVMVMRTTSNPAGQRAANILLRMREGAALRRLTVDTIPNAKATLRRLTIEGKFDVMELAQAAELGFRPAPQYLPSFMPGRLVNMPYIAIRELTQQASAAPRVVRRVVENQNGEAVSIPVVHRPRALDL